GRRRRAARTGWCVARREGPTGLERDPADLERTGRRISERGATLLRASWEAWPMTQKEILDELKEIVVERLRFDPSRAAEMTLETTLPKGVDGSLGLDSLDFIELSVAIEERFGIMI